ncbi:MAG: transporter substrate-binding domain-containing protein [Candidatus Competibacterales bacterium]
MSRVFPRFPLVPLCLAVLTLGVVSPAVLADVMDTIRERGTLIVGVKADYPPYGYRNPEGEIVGIEPELAQDVADELGVELELVPVVSSNRMQFLQQGKIDLMIATMTDRPDRRKVVQIVDPNYYSSGTNVMALKKANFEAWEDLDGKPICAIQGAFYNKKTQREFGAELVAFKGTAEVLNALKQGRCLGFVYDDSFLVSKLSEAEWSDYEMALPTIDDAPWGLAVALGEDEFAAFMGEMIENWHASGRILELESQYGVDNTPFAQQMHEKYQAN